MKHALLTWWDGLTDLKAWLVGMAIAAVGYAIVVALGARVLI